MGPVYSLNLGKCHLCVFCTSRRPGWQGGTARCAAHPDEPDIRDLAAGGQCPKHVFTEAEPAPAPASPPPAAAAGTPMAADLGQALWRELHTATEDTEAVLASVTSRIPCGECKRHWIAYVAKHPPDYGRGWFAWTVAAHNAVNKRLGKKCVTIRAARALWPMVQRRRP